MRGGNMNRDWFEWFFQVIFPKLFIGIFATAILMFISILVAVVWFGVVIFSDPEGAANSAGNIVGEFVAPIAQSVDGE